MDRPPLHGIHHVTAICGEAQTNVDFYAGLLGLRLVKVTVNFDDPTAYHLYYGDAVGTPGTILTFFPYPDGRKGQPGNGAFETISLAVPPGALDYWRDRLRDIPLNEEADPFDGSAIDFADPDGLQLRIVEADQEGTQPYGAVVPKEVAIRGVHEIHLASSNPKSAEFAMYMLEYLERGNDEGETRFELQYAERGQFLRIRPEVLKPHGGQGQIHHTALRTRTDDDQAVWLEALKHHGTHTSPVMNRDYFQSIYFREPGGALWEIATDGPGFAIDEDEALIGRRLCLPPQFEAQRAQIVAGLPELRLPTGEALLV